MSTQTKLLSAATVLSTLGDNDKVVVTTEAGATGLVSKATLKSEMGLTHKTGEPSQTTGTWIRIAECTPVFAGVVFCIQNYYDKVPQPIILEACASYDANNIILKQSSAGCAYFSKARIITSAWNSKRYIDILTTGEESHNVISVSVSGIGITALTPSVAPAAETYYSKEVALGG